MSLLVFISPTPRTPISPLLPYTTLFRSGRWNVEHKIIPMAKIEYVTTDQGPFLRKAGLYSLNIGTTASSHKIPAIPEEEALKLRSLIASYANVKEDDSFE